MTDKELANILKSIHYKYPNTFLGSEEMVSIGLACKMAAERIERLQAENRQLQEQFTAKETTQNGTYIDINTHFRDIKKLQSENTRLQAELDKAVEDMAFNAGDGGCWKTCATHYCSYCNDGDKFIWRGLEESE